ncbi:MULTISPECIES: hypothetical protein [unclassified Actinotalea]|uniref:hypothetical protein n=1 Tax=unclassified Actinotalea TaxID=2638618 RepID=UPI0015F417DE|nr:MULTISPECIES: hypothetical protein [unclassified Actinotalea]
MTDAAAGRTSPATGGLDRAALSTYLNDHLAGAVAGSHRMRRTAEALARTPVGPGLTRVADEVEGEREELRALIGDLDLVQARPKQVATWAGERLARLKTSGAGLQREPLTALLEVELLRSAVVGKRGLWQTMTALAPALGVDADRCRELWGQTDRQVATLDEVHDYVRSRVLREAAR